MGWIITGAKLYSNLGQVVHTYVSLSPSSITWCWSKDGDVLQLGRWPQAWQKVMAAYHPRWLEKSPVGWMPVHWDQLQAQRSVTSTGELYLLLEQARCFKLTNTNGHSYLLWSAKVIYMLYNPSVDPPSSSSWSVVSVVWNECYSGYSATGITASDEVQLSLISTLDEVPLHCP